MSLTFIYAKTLFESSIFNWFYLYSPSSSLHYWYLVMNNITWYVFKRALRDLLKFFKKISLLYSTIPIIFILKFTFTVYEKLAIMLQSKSWYIFFIIHCIQNIAADIIMLWDIILLDQGTVVILYLNKQLIYFTMRRTTYWTKSIFF